MLHLSYILPVSDLCHVLGVGREGEAEILEEEERGEGGETQS